ncbi:cysteine desulfurase [Mesorhizobium sp. M2D.F.Ca.ET.185.01.1.1]|uniref:cysteine desulfurase family protein n=1 Tax=unclassified Mesorhizobium TaxID=325217 RepID=UPI000FCA3B67|nr:MULTISPECIES: cysteine desulfurase family protein [unclassified Mesorhizobium]TGP52981.1 cysteine desulfurase [bacterium M00.F.Ca.ET.230.01.1.1]TGP80742.1 cysteine desulfurase [bacterium M00.F.Ca.ET.227.01.1.1]TGP90526.1 cysteine desulfurase [bacterium M00.F.Ca.ET.221.01.1.1]TGP97206.1 cysteine desulfurase [bacterium M00.F.Ca.ET.222.01.1.1]TGT75738.1 cysteine desulfurase [bacterium M00.F.Ca.ET.159.01.1.1]TGT84801.1 cysteine desulfurase [bacterium M00.F.Ca.ET.157.01.1.1]TGU02016.1 cysteine
MAATRAYLDYNASAPLIAEARAAMVAALDAANPSSVHTEGRASRRLVEDARRDVARLVNARPEHVVFTSGATEAASTLLTPDWQMGRGAIRMSHLYVSEADHPCILNGGRFAATQVTKIGVDRNGIADLEALATALAAHDKGAGLPLVAIHAANNETGVVQPVKRIAEIVKAAGGVLVVDAVQAAGRIPLDMSAPYADYLILSSHKIGGPKGVGAIVAASDLMMPRPLVSGGGQEKGHRAGTENVAGVPGFGAAARAALAGLDDIDAIARRRDEIEAIVTELAPDAEIFGNGAQRLANTTFFAIPGVKAETAQIAFDLAGVALSAGSACSSGKVGPSHVLKAMGHGDSLGALRVSIGPATGAEDIAAFRAALAGIVARRAGKEQAA